MGTAWQWRCALLGTLSTAFVAAACGEDEAPRDRLAGESADVATRKNTPSGQGGRYDDARALEWLTRECGSCHGTDPKTGTAMPYRSAWPIPNEGVTRSFLEVSELTPIAYQTLRHTALKYTTGTPAAMPPS